MTVRCRALRLRRAFPVTPCLRAIWLPKAGSARHHQPLQRDLGTTTAGATGLGSYKSAWLMLQKLRRAMVNPGTICMFGVSPTVPTGNPVEQWALVSIYRRNLHAHGNFKLPLRSISWGGRSKRDKPSLWIGGPQPPRPRGLCDHTSAKRPPPGNPGNHEGRHR